MNGISKVISYHFSYFEMDEYDDSSTSVKPSTHQIAYILECKNKIESGSKKLYFDPFDEPPSGINVSDYYLKPLYVINIDPKQFTCCDCKQKFSAVHKYKYK